MLLLPELGLGVAVLANAAGFRGIVPRLAEAILTRVTKTIAEPLPTDLILAELQQKLQIAQAV